MFLSGFAPEIRDLADRLRSVAREAIPEAPERVRTGWRLIGYDVPIGRRTRYFAFVAPEPEHVHLGPGDTIPLDALVRYTREAAELAAMGVRERA